MDENPHALSDALSELRSRFREFEHGGVVMEGEAVAATCAVLKELLMRAHRLENELARLQWNERARNGRRAEKNRAQALVDALQLPNTNVALFPVIPRPFGDGRPA